MKKLIFSSVAAITVIIMSTVVAFACIDWPPQNWELEAAVGAPFTHQIVADSSCDDGVSSWGLRSGDLPPGLSFSDGLISGTPTETGTFGFMVYAVDGCGPFDSLPITVAVQGTEAPLAVEPAAAPTVLNYYRTFGGTTVPNHGVRSFVGERTVFLSTATAGAEIRYTTDGTAPTATSALYDPATGIVISETTTIRAIATHADYDTSPEMVAESPEQPGDGVTFTQIAPGAGETKLVSGLRPTLGATPWPDDPRNPAEPGANPWPSGKNQLGWLARAAGNTFENFDHAGFNHVAAEAGHFTYEFENLDGTIQGRVQGDNGTITIFERNGDNFTPVTSGATFEFANQFTRYFNTITAHGHDHPRTVTPWGIVVERFPVWTRQQVYDRGRPDGAPVFVVRYPENSIYFVYEANTPIGPISAMFTRHECLGIEMWEPTAAPTVLNYYRTYGGTTVPNHGVRSFVGERTVFLRTATPGAQIRFTTDGTAPTATSTLYNPATGIVITETTTIRAIATHTAFGNSPEMVAESPAQPGAGVTFTQIAPGAGEIKLVSDLRPTLGATLWPDDPRNTAEPGANPWPAAKNQLAWIARAAGNTSENFAHATFDHVAAVDGQFTYEFTNLAGTIQGRVQGDNGTITIFEGNGDSFTAVTSGATFDFANQFTRYFDTMTALEHDHPRTVTPWGIVVERWPVWTRQRVYDHGRPEGAPVFAVRYPERTIYFAYSANTPIGPMTAMFTRQQGPGPGPGPGFGAVPSTGLPDFTAATMALQISLLFAVILWLGALGLKFSKANND